MNKSFLILILLIGCVNAYTLTYEIDNSLSLLPITGANITLTNDTFILSNLTETSGLSDLSSSTNAVFQVLVYKGGYNNYVSTLIANNNSYHKVLLTPSSAEGIIKLRVEDLTLIKHTFCLYWVSNNRLYKCFNVNDSYITITNNENYTLVPDIDKVDLITSPTNLKDNLYLIIPAFLGILVFALILFSFVAICIFIYNKIKR